jgi:hypothetical protein
MALDSLNWEFERVHGLIVEEVPAGRYRALALTALEQASVGEQGNREGVGHA